MSENTFLLIGRILLAVIFVISGFGKLTDIAGTTGFFGSLGLPVPTLTAVAAGLVELLGGLAVLIGYKTRIAAIVLAAFTLAASFIAHLNFADQMQLLMFLKNLAIVGGFLALAAHGAGRLSLDARQA